MRIDKFLHAMRIGTRTQVRRLIKDGHITTNGEPVLSGKQQVNPGNDTVLLDDEPVRYQQFFYYVLNKPVGAITATVIPRPRPSSTYSTRRITATICFPLAV